MCQSLLVVGRYPRIVMNDIIMYRLSCALRGVLGDEEEIVKMGRSDRIVTNSPASRVDKSWLHPLQEETSVDPLGDNNKSQRDRRWQTANSNHFLDSRLQEYKALFRLFCK